MIDFAAVNAAALAILPELLSRSCPDGRIQGREFVARNPRRADRSPGSFSINLTTGKWGDFATGNVGSDIVSLFAYLLNVRPVEAARHLADHLGFPGASNPGARSAVQVRRAPVIPQRQETYDGADQRRKRDIAQSIWFESGLADGTVVEVYLRGRGLRLPDGDAVRFHPRCPCGADRLPAMVAEITDPVSSAFVGIHRTFLRPDGSGKAQIDRPKQMLGGSGVIRLVPDEAVTLGLGIAEGIENALSVMQRAGWGHVWACGSAGGIARFPVLSGIEALSIFADVDDGGAGIDAARSCAEKWANAGREVCIVSPRSGGDWNDVARGLAA